MQLDFSKMHGLGNDFVLIDATESGFPLDRAAIAAIGDRRRGVGFDQMLVALPAADSRAVVAMKVYNTDGSEAEQCGNGIRCFARFVADRGIVSAGKLAIETAKSIVETEQLDSVNVRANMGYPEFDPANIPFLAANRATDYPIVLADQSLRIGAVSMGNPHAVLRVDDVATTPVPVLGAQIQNSGYFPQGVNVGFVERVSERKIRLRVCERGVGETQACGSGACAAVAHGVDAGWLAAQCLVELPGGELLIEWKGEGEPLWMTGPTAYVFEGSMAL